MTASDKTILVIDHDLTTSGQVKELLEFMDSPCVLTAMPEDWQERLGRRRLEALFVGPEVRSEELASLMQGIEAYDPNVPVVMMQAAA